MIKNSIVVLLLPFYFAFMFYTLRVKHEAYLQFEIPGTIRALWLIFLCLYASLISALMMWVSAHPHQ